MQDGKVDSTNLPTEKPKTQAPEKKNNKRVASATEISAGPKAKKTCTEEIVSIIYTSRKAFHTKKSTVRSMMQHYTYSANFVLAHIVYSHSQEYLYVLQEKNSILCNKSNIRYPLILACVLESGSSAQFES